MDNLIDLRTKIWIKLNESNIDEAYATDVVTRLSNITEQLAASISKTEG